MSPVGAQLPLQSPGTKSTHCCTSVSPATSCLMSLPVSALTRCWLYHIADPLHPHCMFHFYWKYLFLLEIAEETASFLASVAPKMKVRAQHPISCMQPVKLRG